MEGNDFFEFCRFSVFWN